MVVQSASENLFLVPRSSYATFVPHDKHHVFAAFASRAALELGQNEAATCLAAEAVHHHMRVLTAVINDELETKAPSEPVLAIAAANAMTANEEVGKQALKTFLEDLILEGLILNRGDQCQLCSRLLFIFARDGAAIKIHKEFMDKNQTRVHSVTLADMLETLLGPEYGCTDPASPDLTPIRKFCKARFINWTHFHTLTKPLDEIPIDLLEWAWFVGAAIQCAQTQPVIDGFMVYYFGDLDKPYNRENLGLIAWQHKARAVNASQELGAHLTVPPIVFKTDDGTETRREKRQTIVLLMDLSTEGFGTKDDPSSMLSLRRATTPYDRPHKLTPSQRHAVWSGYCDPARGEQEPESFLIYIRGRTQYQYPIIDGYKHEFHALFDDSLVGGLSPPHHGLENKMEKLMNPFEYPGEDD